MTDDFYTKMRKKALKKREMEGRRRVQEIRNGGMQKDQFAKKK